MEKMTYLNYLEFFNMGFNEFKENFIGDYRVIKEDDKSYPITDDFNEERLSLIIKENKIIDIYIG